MKRAAQAAGATLVNTVFHTFSPQGVTGVVVVEESHLSIHTWPEHGYAAVDFFTCGDCLPERAHQTLMQGLQAQSAELMGVDRGLPTVGRAIEPRFHRVDRAGEVSASNATESGTGPVASARAMADAE